MDKNHLKSGPMTANLTAIFSKTIWNPGKCTDFEWPIFLAKAIAWLLKHQTILKSDLKKSRFQMFPDVRSQLYKTWDKTSKPRFKGPINWVKKLFPNMTWKIYSRYWKRSSLPGLCCMWCRCRVPMYFLFFKIVQFCRSRLTWSPYLSQSPSIARLITNVVKVKLFTWFKQNTMHDQLFWSSWGLPVGVLCYKWGSVRYDLG